MRIEAGRLWWAAVMLCGLLGAPAWAAPDPGEVAETLRRSVEQLRSTGETTIAGRKLLSVQALPEIYEARGFHRLWSDPANEEALLGEIAAAGGDGLDPADYHFEVLRVVLERRSQQPENAAAAATADLLLTDALLRLVAHLRFGKLDPATARPRWDLHGEIRGEPGTMAVARIATGAALALQLGELRPVQPLYGRFKSALARYRVIEEEGGLEPLPGGRALQVGMESPRIPALRRRLAQSGDYFGAVDSPYFEPELEAAVRRYQARHQLEADGVFGPATRREMNRPVGERISQLRVNLERARWLLAEVRGRFLVVDPAGHSIVLMDNSRPILTVAAEFAPAAESAGEFRTDMRYLVVNPDWVLPTSLVETQIAPLAQRDPAQLEARGLQVFDSKGAAVAPARADWSRPAGLVVRQLPGRRSFLGTLRFSMPNAEQVFLHGGPSEGETIPGSIRLENPEALARALSGPPASWTANDLAAALSRTVPMTLPLGRPVPVLYATWSAWIDPDGTVHFRRGNGARDDAILAGLRRGADSP